MAQLLYRVAEWVWQRSMEALVAWQEEPLPLEAVPEAVLRPALP